VAEALGRAAHELSVRLRPTVLDDLGLQAALRQHLEDWSARTGVATQFQPALPDDRRYHADVETTIYRVVLEALTNVVKHAGARTVSVVIEQHDGLAIAMVEDDGVGFDPEAAASGRLGLLGMRERVALAGGTLEVESSSGSGTTVIARVPLTPPDLTLVSQFILPPEEPRDDG
jgi:signal transduction histidine kinase